MSKKKQQRMQKVIRVCSDCCFSYHFFYLHLYNFMLVAGKIPLDATRPHPKDAANPHPGGVRMLTIIRIYNLFLFSLFVTNDRKIVTIVGWIRIFLS